MMGDSISVRSDLFGSNFLTRIKGEPVALFGTTPRALRHTPTRIAAVYHYHASTGAKVFHEPSAYVMTSTGVARTPDSSIYDFNSYSIAMTGGKYTLVLTNPRNPPISVSLMTYVDYDTGFVEPTLIPALAPSTLKGFIVTAGDSITGAAHTVARETEASDRDGYVGLTRSYFRNVFDVTNFSFDGSSIGQLTSGLPGIIASGPKALSVAFGQNDHVAGLGAPLTSFVDALTDIAEAAQAANIYVILIGFMRKNPLWVNYNEAAAIGYNQAIAGVAAATGAAFVDIDTGWQALKASKTHMELTGDNHHHPSNYGSRFYASALLPYLLSSPVYSSEVPWFIA